jgi:hypothetical protein
VGLVGLPAAAVFCTAVVSAAGLPGAGALPPERMWRVKVDETQAATAGIRKLSGKRLTLYTDLLAQQEVDELPAVFEQAFSQWCRYFGVEAAAVAHWKMQGFLIKDRQRFRQLGLLPDYLPPFNDGWSQGHELWLYEQPSAYYRRHLLIHEGVHGFMNTQLGGCGPPWYMEGMAEFLGTNRWREGQLKLGYFPTSREEVPHWGRIRLIREAQESGLALRLPQVLALGPAAFLEKQPYAWAWAAAVFLDTHPAYQQRFRALYRHVREPPAEFNRHFRQLFAADWEQMCEEWQVFVSDIDYGYDIARNAVAFAPGEPLPPQGAVVSVAADRGWQSSGFRLAAGQKYRLRASGRYQLATKPRIWWCEPNGVSIRYYQGQPLGVLLAALRPERAGPDAPSALLRPLVVGLETTLAPQQDATLYLKINDSPAELADNAGAAKLEIRLEPTP